MSGRSTFTKELYQPLSSDRSGEIRRSGTTLGPRLSGQQLVVKPHHALYYLALVKFRYRLPPCSVAEPLSEGWRRQQFLDRQRQRARIPYGRQQSVLTIVDNIAAAFTEHDPDNAATYAANAESYKQEIRDTITPLRDRIAQIPEDQRWLVTCEGAFSYLARDFGMKELYLWPMNADQTGTPQQVRKVIDSVRDNDIPVVFCESTVNTSPAKQVAQAVETLRALPDCVLVSESGLYRSSPMGPADQPDFINAVVALVTAKAYSVSCFSANSCSNSRTIGPAVNQPLISGSLRASHSSIPIAGRDI